MKKQKKLSTKITALIMAGVFLSFGIFTLIITVDTSKNIAELQKKELNLLAQANAKVVKETIEAMVNKQGVLITAVKTLQTATEQVRNAALSNMIATTNAEEADILSLYYVAAKSEQEPNGMTVFSTSSKTQIVPNQTAQLSAEDYKSLENVKTLKVADPYHKTIDGKEYLVISVLQPVLDSQGNFIGVIGSDIDTSVLNSASYNTGDFQSFSNSITCGHQTIIMDTLTPEIVGEKFADATRSKNPDLILDTATDATARSFIDEFKDGTKNYRSCVPFYIGNSKTVWISATTISENEFYAPVYTQIKLIIMVSLIAVVLLSILCYYILHKSFKPINEIDHAAEEMSQGNLKAEITFTGATEIGRLADSMRHFMSTIAAYINDIDKAMEEMSGGNFDVGASQPFIGDFKNIEDSIDKFILDISQTISEIRRISEQVSSGSEQVSNGAQILAQGAVEQTGAVQALAETITEISHHINNTAKNAQLADFHVKDAGQSLNSCNNQMMELNAAIGEISEKSTEIKKIIKTIEDIAFQTNILALNAAVEAARAGTAGKGFAVVADEVRNLASKSAEAAQSTTMLIESSIFAVENGKKISDATVLSLVDVVKKSESVTESMDKIALAAEQQASSILKITLGIDQIANVVQTNSATAEESAAASEELSGQAQTLKHLVSKFKLKS